ncbi:MAG: hydrogenase formation protein HypD [Polyangiales bacterium]
MKALAPYRDPARIAALAEAIRRRVTRPWTVMEICGGQTHSIVKHGLDTLLPPELVLVHGPGCPVCVTPVETLDRALAIAARPEVVFCTFGDMLRVPGSKGDLQGVKARGGDVRVVHSPLDAVELAARTPEREIVFFAVGFETTAPVHALAILEAERRSVTNFTVLTALVRVPPALEALLADGDHRLDGLLAAGHVCAVMGTAEYEPIARAHGLPIVVTGFEPVDVLEGLLRCVAQLEQGRAEVEIQYDRVVRPEGNLAARRAIETVFEAIDQAWRGLGTLPSSGFGLRAAYAAYDARLRFASDACAAEPSTVCIAGEVLRGLAKPGDCPAFGRGCTPEHPLGAPMVSSEGACAAYHRYRPSPEPTP